MILYLNPTLVLLLSVLLLGQRVRASQIAALGVSYAGVLLVFGHEATLEGRDTLLGTSLVFGAAVSYAVYLVYSGAVVRRLGALRLTGWATAAACLFVIAQYLVLHPPQALLAVPAPVVWLSLLNATACTLAPVVMVMMAVERVGATVTAQTGMIGPLATIGMSVLILGEPFTPWLVAGTLLVLVGIWMLARRPRARAPNEG